MSKDEAIETAVKNLYDTVWDQVPELDVYADEEDYSDMTAHDKINWLAEKLSEAS